MLHACADLEASAYGWGQQSLGRPESPWAGMSACCQASIGLQDLAPTRLACLISANTSQVWPDRMRRPPLPRPRASKPPSRLKVMLLMSGAPSMRLESAGSRGGWSLVCRAKAAQGHAGELGVWAVLGGQKAA